MIEFSTESREGPFTEVFKTDIPLNTRSELALDTPQQARWIRLSILENYGYLNYIELMVFEAYGKAGESSIQADIREGVCQTNWDTFFLQINEEGISGCYDHDNGTFTGYYNDGFLNITWREDGGQQGKASLALTRDGEVFNGFWCQGGSLNGTWRGKRSNTLA